MDDNGSPMVIPSSQDTIPYPADEPESQVAQVAQPSQPSRPSSPARPQRASISASPPQAPTPPSARDGYNLRHSTGEKLYPYTSIRYLGAVAQLQSSELIFATFFNILFKLNSLCTPYPWVLFSFFLLERPDEYQPPNRPRTRRGGRGRGGRGGGGRRQSHDTGQNGGGRGHPRNATESEGNIVDDARARVSAWLRRGHGWDRQPPEQHLHFMTTTTVNIFLK